MKATNLKADIRIITKLKKQKNITSKDAKIQGGVANFYELGQAIQSGSVSNASNRDVELDLPKNYIKKVNHLIRLASGISNKNPILMSILRDRPNLKAAYIRDDGTITALCIPGGEYYDQAVVTPNQIIAEIRKIEEEYDVSQLDRHFINLLELVFNDMSEEKKSVPISWKDIVEANDTIKEYYLETTLEYSIDLYTFKNHSQDMINVNLQVNPWSAFTFYWTPNKLEKEYQDRLLGQQLLDYLSTKDGLKYATQGRILGHIGSGDKTTKSDALKTFVVAYVGAKFVNTLDDMRKYYHMIQLFPKNETQPTVKKYWIGMFNKFIKEVSFSEAKEFYEKEYSTVYAHDAWGHKDTGINRVISKMIDKTGKTSCDAIWKHNIQKWHNGVFFIAFAIWAKHNYNKGWDKTVEMVVDEYIKTLNGKVFIAADVNNPKNFKTGNYDLYEALFFGYISTDAVARMKYIIGPTLSNIESRVKERKTDRNSVASLRARELSKHLELLESQGVSVARLTMFPLASNGSLTQTQVVNFMNGDNLEHLHPNDKSNLAKDGFLGLYDDNHAKDFKKKDWKAAGVDQNKYWELIRNHNEKKLPKLDDDRLRKKIEDSLRVLDIFCETDLSI